MITDDEIKKMDAASKKALDVIKADLKDQPAYNSAKAKDKNWDKDFWETRNIINETYIRFLISDWVPYISLKNYFRWFF